MTPIQLAEWLEMLAVQPHERASTCLKAAAAACRALDAHQTHGIEREVLSHSQEYPCSHPGCIIYRADKAVEDALAKCKP